MNATGMGVLRASLWILATIELVLGVWNQFWPESFYRDVPTVDVTPPFSEHYARDFGGATLGIAVLLVVAAILPRTALAPVAGLAYKAFALPHFVFHVGHLHGATQLEASILTLANGAGLALGVLVVVLGLVALRRRGASTPQTVAS